MAPKSVTAWGRSSQTSNSSLQATGDGSTVTSPDATRSPQSDSDSCSREPRTVRPLWDQMGSGASKAAAASSGASKPMSFLLSLFTFKVSKSQLNDSFLDALVAVRQCVNQSEKFDAMLLNFSSPGLVCHNNSTHRRLAQLHPLT